MRLAVLLLALVTMGTASAVAQRPRENRDVTWFQAHPQILDETLRRCQRDARLAASWECQNAEAAGASRMGRPLPTTLPPASLGRQVPPVDNSGLPEPDFNPRTNPLGYATLQSACANQASNPTHIFLPYCSQLERYREGRSVGR
jgi:hypothetical protein